MCWKGLKAGLTTISIAARWAAGVCAAYPGSNRNWRWARANKAPAVSRLAMPSASVEGGTPDGWRDQCGGNAIRAGLEKGLARSGQAALGREGVKRE
jgi:hypothetical protein